MRGESESTLDAGAHGPGILVEQIMSLLNERPIKREKLIGDLVPEGQQHRPVLRVH